MAGVEGRVVAITGAGNGLGREYALVLARAGAKVVVNDLGGSRDGTGSGSTAADAVVAEIRAEGGEATANHDSVATPEGGAAVVATALDAYGRIDGVVANAGILRDRSFHTMTDQDWDAVQQVHLYGAFHVVHAAWPHFREQGHGRVVVATSTSGIYGNFGQANYGAAKMALVGLMQTLAIEGAKYGIKVNSLAPTAYTRMMEGILPQEQLDALEPGLVSPALLPLVVEDAPTRAIVCAGAGHFARAHVTLTQGRYIGGGADAGERLIAAWDEVSSTQGQVIPDYGFTQAEREVASARAHARADAPA